MMPWWAWACLMASDPLAGASPAPDPAIFALIVGNNASADDGVPPLRYADDDAARFYELVTSWRQASAEVLVELDQDSQRTFPGVATASRPPTLDVLRQAMSRLGAAIRAAQAAGQSTVFYFYFAGHGSIGGGHEGYVSLAGARLTRSMLYEEVIARSPADLNHILIDACNAFLVVNRGERATSAVRSFLERESLVHYPNTGVVLSTASEAETHEWSQYRSGIFSHQLLSALWGAAEVDGNGRVDYAELAAYIAAANSKVRDQRARLFIFARPPPSQRDAPLVALSRFAQDTPRGAGFGGFLEVPKAVAGHYYLEDDRGVRHADFHKAADAPLSLALLARPYYYLRNPSHEVRVEPHGAEAVVLDLAGLVERQAHSRGSLEQSFRRDLYAVPFDRSFAEGFRDALAGPTLEASAYAGGERFAPWKWTAGAVTAVALATSLALQLKATSVERKLDPDAGLSARQARELQTDAARLQAGAGIALGIGLAGAGALVTLFVVAGEGSDAPSVLPSGASATLRF